jgi:DNA mismatch endonuclease (patch repair protein)
MSRIRGRDTKPETALRSALWRRGLRFRKTTGLRGKPDIVFATARVVVFVDGCFWHRCPEHQTRPASNAAFWDGKLSENVARDRRTDAALEAEGWTVVRIWEHEVEQALDAVTQRVYDLVVGERVTSKGAAGRPAARNHRVPRSKAR